jgi:hypothetical protein
MNSWRCPMNKHTLVLAGCYILGVATMGIAYQLYLHIAG